MHIFNYGSPFILTLLGRDRGEGLILITTLGTPRNIMQVAECVNIEDVREARCDEQVLNERGKHVPWVAVEEGREEIDTYFTNGQAPPKIAIRLHSPNVDTNAAIKTPFVPLNKDVTLSPTVVEVVRLMDCNSE